MDIRKVRFQIERFLFWIVRILTRLLPKRALLFLGNRFGRLAFHLDRRHRGVAMENWQSAFPGASNADAEAGIRRCYEYFGSYLFILLHYFKGLDPDWAKHFEFQGLEHLEAALQEGKGVLLFGAHFGAWEILAMAQAAHGFPMGVVARTLDNPYLERLLRKVRCATGNFIIDKREGFRPMLKAMRDGKIIAVLIDQNVTTEDRIFVDFFGKPASTTPALALLKLKTEAALVPAFAYPLGEDRFRFEYDPALEVKLSGDRTEDVKTITQACTAVLEEKIRRNPQYWLWMHRRWKTRPLPAISQNAEGAVAG